MAITASASTPTIEAQVRLHRDAQTFADEWSGVTDPVLRRKLQNRLNQRAARRRRAARSSSEPSNSTSNPPNERTLPRVNGGPDLMQLMLQRARSSQRWLQKVIPEENPGTFRSIRDANPCRPAPAMTELLGDRLSEIQTLYQRIMRERDSSWMYPLPADHLLTLVYYNVYRALIANVAILGLDLDLMVTDEYPSPFTPLSPTASSAIRSLPPCLQPTELQRSIAHHPQWDIVPDPAIRDNLLRKGEPNIDDVELCMDLIGSEARRQRAQTSTEAAGCMVWGDPWAAESWEVTEAFVKKYPWLFEGASYIKQSTNAWRVKRDEPPLRFEELGIE